MNWIYKGKEITCIEDLEIENPYGFIYVIETQQGFKYIGKKSFFSHRTLPPLKGKKRKRKVVKESNWKTYNSSNSQIDKTNIAFKEILEVCLTKRDLTYKEVKYQFKYNVLESKDYLNDNILGKFYSKHM